jgi:glycosyltransferase involved in cell wall biosynthesis
MIVKNEEKNVKRCLESAAHIANEIIIVDTGSTDRTKEVCQMFGAAVYDYEWMEDFSAARNFCIGKASSDWILWLDADEEFIGGSSAIQEALKQERIDLYSIQLRHLTEGEGEEAGSYLSYHHRLFRNYKGFYFQGTIHERLAPPKALSSLEPVVIDSVRINHYGYQQKDSAVKSLRNLKLLIKEKEKEKENPWLDYHISTELYRLKDISRAYYFVNHAITLFVARNLLPPALAYKLKYDIIVNYASLEHAGQGIDRALELYPDYVELHFYKGRILFHQKSYEEGIKVFTHCIVLGEYHPEYLIQAGNGSFNAYYYIGKGYEALNKPEYAKEAYRQSLLSNPNFKPSLQRLESLTRQEVVQ